MRTLDKALLLFSRRYHSLFESERPPIFLDLGSGDGRVVALAHLLGYRCFGIEGDNETRISSTLFLRALMERVAFA